MFNALFYYSALSLLNFIVSLSFPCRNSYLNGYAFDFTCIEQISKQFVILLSVNKCNEQSKYFEGFYWHTLHLQYFSTLLR